MSARPRMLARARRILSALLATVVVAGGLTLVAGPASAVAPTAAPTNGTATIVVKAGGVRDAVTGTVGGLAGVVLELRPASGGGAVATCTSDADGDCVFTTPVIPGGSSVNYVVTAQSTPAGYYANPRFVTNSGSNGAANTALDYRLTVNGIQRNTLTKVAANGSAATTSAGAWQSSLDNPAGQQKCGLNIAVISDLSSSVAMSNSLGALKNAATGFVNALEGTPSTISLFTFGTSTPAPNTASLTGQSALNPSHITALRNTISNYTIQNSGNNYSYTNWDAAFRQVLGGGYDQVVVITDGNPTRYGPNAAVSGSGGATRFVELENAIFSANAVKAQGMRVVAVGVGGSDSFFAGQNLRAISGPTVGSDYFISGWSDLASTLTTLAKANCAGTVTVVKQVVPYGATGTTGAAPAGGWTFTAPTVSTGAVTPSNAQVTKTNAGQGDHGTINYKLSNIPAGATFTVAEQQQNGYTLLPQGGKNAVCVKNGGAAVTVTNSGALGFSVPVGQSDIVTCTVYNQAPQPRAEITVHKQWVVNGVAQALDVHPNGFAAQATLGGSNAVWNTATSVPAGSVVVDEGTPTVPAPFCTLVSQRVTSFNGGAVGPVDLAGAGSYTTPALAQRSSNSVTITNTVTCTGQLTLLKNVVNGTTGGSAAPTDWTLTATPPAGTAVSGATGVSGAVAADVAYTLTETGGPAGYAQTAIQCAPSADGPWTGPSVTSVTVAAQQHTYCRFTNTAQAPRVQLTKVVTGGVADADNWTLTATPAAGAAISGNGVAPYATAVAGTSYALTEKAVAGFDDAEFTGSAWTCTVTAGPGVGTKTTGTSVTPALGQDVECVITNTARAVVPAFTKDAGTATANADGTWDLTYTLTASNPSTVLPLDYDLSDTPALPTGTQAVSALVTRGGATVLDVPAWGGGILDIVSGERIAPAGAAHVYTVTLTVRVPATVDPALLRCGTAGRGFDNEATLTPAVGAPITDDACVSVVPPTVAVAKKVTSLTQDPVTGDWTVTYDVTATATGTGVARYDLGDAFAFGPGISIVSASVAAQGGAPTPNAAWTGVAPDTGLLSDAILAGGSTHVYTVTAVASVAAGVTGTAAADCTLAAPESGTGLLNRATLTAGGSTSVATACEKPVLPTLDKSFVSATQNPDASWAVTFSVLVENPSATTDVAYSLDDVPGFATGATATDRTVSLDGAAPSAWDGVAPLASGRVLPAGERDEYLVVFTVTVDPGMPPALQKCDAAGPGNGFFNEATLTAGVDTLVDDDCGPIAESVLPLVEKTVDAGFPRQLADGDWEIRYSVTVSTPAGTAVSTRYDLDDVLAFGAGATIVSSSASGPAGAIAGWTGAAPDVQLADDVLLPGGAKHVYTVTARAELPAGFPTSDAADCTLDAQESGTGFRNTVELRSGSATRTADACASPARPTLDKTLAAPVKNADGTVDLTYTVTVGNPSGLDLVYDLEDELGLASGVSVLSATATGPVGVTVDAAWTGRGATTTLVTSQALAAGETQVYTIVVRVRPTLFVDIADQTCVAATPGKGYFNGAVLTSGAEVLTDDACAPIPDNDLPTLPFPDPDLPTLAMTGAQTAGGLGTALLLLLGGLGALVLRRRPKGAHRS